MKKIKILSIMLIFGLFGLPMAFLSHSAFIWAEEAKLMPMELDGTEWDVAMVYVTKKGNKNNSEDKLMFTDKKFISESFENQGYDPTNYSLTIQDDGTTKFGTMQIKGKDTSFWKGTIKDGEIDGSVHTQFSGGKSTRTTYFNGSLITGELKRKVKKKPTPPPPPAIVKPVEPVQQIEETVPVTEQVPAVPDQLVAEGANEAVNKTATEIFEETD